MSYLLNPHILNTDPFDFGNPAIWLDVSDTSTIQTTSGRVSQWSDKSLNGNHFVQTNAAKRPIFNNNSIYLEPNGAYHLQNSSFSRNTNSLTAFMVAEQQSKGSGTNIYGRWISFYLNTGLDYNNLNSIILTDLNTPNIAVYRNSATQVSTSSLTANTKTLLGFELNGSSVTVHRNASSTGGTTSATSINIDRVRLGADTVEADSNLNGRYYEVIVYPEVLSAENIAGVKNYLKDKWSVY